MTITETGRGYEIQFEFRPKIVAEIKAMPGNRYFGKTKGWFVPHLAERHNPDQSISKFYNKEAMEKFKKKYGTIQPGADAPEQVFKINDLPELTITLPWKQGVTPYPYQNNGIARGLELKRFINGDQPGLGKSMQAIGTILGFESLWQHPFPCLIICPSTLKENWRREIEDKFSTKRAVILDNKSKDNWHSLARMGMADFIICNYESLWGLFVTGTRNKPGTKPTLKEMDFDPRHTLIKSVIIDELHKLKDPTTRQAKVSKGITAGKEIIIGLTGTPVVNKPKDLLSQLAIINQLHLFGGWKYFQDRYCEGGTGSNFEAELNSKLLNICFFRREKKDVLKDLPDKTREVITCDITTRAEYNLAKTDLGTFLRQQGYSEKQVNKSLNAEIMVRIGKLKAISAQGKLPEAIEHIQEVVDAGEKIVVFIHQKFMANALMTAFPGSVCVRGTEVDEHTGKEKPQSVQSRQMAVDAFQRDPNVQVIICSIKAAGVGITLTESSRLIFLELPWHPADVEQCEDRIHRIGQKNAAQISYFLGKNTIDEEIYKIIEKKREISDAITGTTTTIDTMLTDLTRTLFNQR